MSASIFEPWPLSFEDLVSLSKVVILVKDWTLVVESFKGIVSLNNIVTNTATKNNLEGEASSLGG